MRNLSRQVALACFIYTLRLGALLAGVMIGGYLTKLVMYD